MASPQYLSSACEPQIQATPNSSAGLGLDDQQISYECLRPASGLIHVPAYGYPVLNRSPIVTTQPLFYHSPERTYIKQFNADCNNPRKYTEHLALSLHTWRRRGECFADSVFTTKCHSGSWAPKSTKKCLYQNTCICGYGDVLLRRAQQLPKCSDGKRVQRRGSLRNPVFTKLAEDCDTSDISSILSKPKTSTGTKCHTKSQTELEPDENQSMHQTRQPGL